MFARGKKTAPEALPRADIESAIEQLRVPGALCYARLWSTNQGLSGELSFNSASATTASGQLEVTLKEATIEIASPAVAPDWTWNEGLLEAAETSTSKIEHTSAGTQGDTNSHSRDRAAKVSGKGKLGVPLASAELGSEVSEGVKDESSSARTEMRQLRFTRDIRQIKVEKRPTSFRVKFMANPLEDLSDLNTRLTRLPLVDVPEPAGLDLTLICVDLLMSHDPDGDEVRHAFNIRKATGKWRPLKDNPKRAVLAELLISKFLPDLHAAQRLLPREADPESSR